MSFQVALGQRLALAKPDPLQDLRNMQNLFVKENNKYFALFLQVRLYTKLRVDLSERI